jgi:hypothetical protein
MRKGEYYEKSIKQIKERREEQRQEDIDNVKDRKSSAKARKRTTKGKSSQIEQEELMDFGSERERGDSIGLHNYLLY